MEPKGDTNTVFTQSLAAAITNAGLSIHCYVCVKGSLHANDCSAFGLGEAEIKALSAKFPGSGVDVVNGVSIKANVLNCINVLSQLGYKVASTAGESEITWTLQREV